MRIVRLPSTDRGSGNESHAIAEVATDEDLFVLEE